MTVTVATICYNPPPLRQVTTISLSVDTDRMGSGPMRVSLRHDTIATVVHQISLIHSRKHAAFTSSALDYNNI